MIECVIFDCDGTLVDSEHLCNLALKVKLCEYGIDVSVDELQKRYSGEKLDWTLQSLQQEYAVSFSDNFLPEYRHLVAGLFRDNLQACDGVFEALASIDKLMCVASNGPKEKILQALTITGLNDYFAGHIFSAYDITKWKPDPDLFLKAASTMQVSPSACLVVENSIVGIEAALTAGMSSLLYAPKGDCDDQNIRCFSHYRQLPGLL